MAKATSQAELLERWALTGTQNVTLQGEPARIVGYNQPFAKVQLTSGKFAGMSAEWSWEAIANVVKNRNGAFTF